MADSTSHHHIPNTQHQYQVVENKKPLQAVEVPVKQPSADEVLVELHGSSINPLGKSICQLIPLNNITTQVYTNNIQHILIVCQIGNYKMCPCGA